MKHSKYLGILALCLLLLGAYMIFSGPKHSGPMVVHEEQVDDEVYDAEESPEGVKNIENKESKKATHQQNVFPEDDDQGEERQEVSEYDDPDIPEDTTPKEPNFDKGLIKEMKDLPQEAQFSKKEMKALRGLAKDIDRTLNDLDVESENEDIGNGEHLKEGEMDEAKSDVQDDENPEEDEK